jgi:hypothetical protein
MNKQSNNNPITGLDGYPRTKNLEEEISLNFTSSQRQLVKLVYSIYEVLQ